jgi:hypothetical protein
MFSERKGAQGIPVAFKFRLSSQLGDAQAIVPHKSRGPKSTWTASSHEGIQFPPDKRPPRILQASFWMLAIDSRYVVVVCMMRYEVVALPKLGNVLSNSMVQ